MRFRILFLFALLLAGCAHVPQTALPTPTSLPTAALHTLTLARTPLPPTWTPTATRLASTPTKMPTIAAVPTWTDIPPTANPFPAELGFIDIRMFDAKTGWALDQSGHVLHTNIGPMTWHDVTPWNEELKPAAAVRISFLSARTAMAVLSIPNQQIGLEITTWRTQDAGAT